MTSKRHVLFNLCMILIPWLSLRFIGKRYIKRFFLASFIIFVFEVLNHLYGRNRKWWKFYDKPSSFLRDEFPFDIGPYMPMSMWILKYSYGNFKKFVAINAIANGMFAFLYIPFLKKIKIVRLDRLTYFQFFLYIHYKAYLLYGVQNLYERVRKVNNGEGKESI
ncbi:hypothetical protein [Guptibacillus algicola]|uniref:hypothetical protein n=1 Tax=Guptibacillus algicola TaxID=225844 RepID=UPI001CD57ABE|nr:hypothetical protein [Alkalihalobacillus algicola]MCA0987150.1 hypothetical protein [Alkalihalobacillus algicola]